MLNMLQTCCSLSGPFLTLVFGLGIYCKDFPGNTFCSHFLLGLFVIAFLLGLLCWRFLFFPLSNGFLSGDAIRRPRFAQTTLSREREKKLLNMKA